MKEKKNALLILAIVAFSALFMSFVDGFLHPPYFYKSLIKLGMFFLPPLIYFCAFPQERRQFRAMLCPAKGQLLRAAALGLVLYGVILGGFFLVKNRIDLSAIRDSLVSGMGVTAENFLWVSLYISFVNSLLEEFFFRGFGFLTLKNHVGRRFACGFSALFFALYHVGMTGGWFSPGLYALSIAGLFVGGCIFNVLDEKQGNIYFSWLVHMWANFAINTVGFMAFGII